MSQRSPFNKRNMPQMSEDDKPAKTGMARKSASSAKPAREAAGTVRVVSVKKDSFGGTVGKNMTKEEKKELRRKEREEEDQVAAITSMVTKNNPVYAKRRRIWWYLMGLGVLCLIFSFIGSYYNTQQGVGSYDLTTPIGIFTVVNLAVAYIGIIAALVWEFTKIRPIRQQTEAEISSMSAKRRAAVVEKCDAMEEERKASRKKGAKAKADTVAESKSTK